MDKELDYAALRILIIDDSQFARKITRDMLGSFGVREVMLASDAAEGITVLKTRPVDLVLVDREMPILNGVEFTRLVRRDKEISNCDVPIVMISSHTEKGKIIEARKAGVQEFVAKPYSAEALKIRVDAALARSRQPIGGEAETVAAGKPSASANLPGAAVA